jgi:hypothetical protein
MSGGSGVSTAKGSAADGAAKSNGKEESKEEA